MFDECFLRSPQEGVSHTILDQMHKNF